MNSYKLYFYLLLSIITLVSALIGFILLGTERGYFFTKRIDSLPAGRYHNHLHEMHQLYNKHQTDSVIVMLGNSITYECAWNELLNRDDVINRGIPGETIEGIIDRLPTILLSPTKSVVLMAGINNILNGDKTINLTKHYTELLDSIRTKTDLIVCATLYTSIYTNIHSEITELNLFLKQYCQQHQLPYIDLNSALVSKDHLLERKYTYDGVHLNSKGYEVWRDALMPNLP